MNIHTSIHLCRVKQKNKNFSRDHVQPFLIFTVDSKQVEAEDYKNNNVILYTSLRIYMDWCTQQSQLTRLLLYTFVLVYYKIAHYCESRGTLPVLKAPSASLHHCLCQPQFSTGRYLCASCDAQPNSNLTGGDQIQFPCTAWSIVPHYRLQYCILGKTKHVHNMYMHACHLNALSQNILCSGALPLRMIAPMKSEALHMSDSMEGSLFVYSQRRCENESHIANSVFKTMSTGEACWVFQNFLSASKHSTGWIQHVHEWLRRHACKLTLPTTAKQKHPDDRGKWLASLCSDAAASSASSACYHCYLSFHNTVQTMNTCACTADKVDQSTVQEWPLKNEWTHNSFACKFAMIMAAESIWEVVILSPHGTQIRKEKLIYT